MVLAHLFACLFRPPSCKAWRGERIPGFQGGLPRSPVGCRPEIAGQDEAESLGGHFRRLDVLRRSALPDLGAGFVKPLWLHQHLMKVRIGKLLFRTFVVDVCRVGRPVA